MTLHLRRLNGSLLNAHMRLSDEPSALGLKAFATTVRAKDTDVVDLWRCLEVCAAARCRPADFANDELSSAAEITRRLFADRNGPGMQAVAIRLSTDAADQRFTRLRALVARVLGLECAPAADGCAVTSPRPAPTDAPPDRLRRRQPGLAARERCPVVR